MKNDETIVVDITSLSDTEHDMIYVRNIKRQSFLLCLLGLVLFSFSMEIKFNNGLLFQQFISNSSFQHPSVFIVFLIASFSNLIASKVLYMEAKNEEENLIKLKEAYIESIDSKF
jgi:hypothetical protein